MEKIQPKAVIFDYGSTLVEYPSTNFDEVMAECIEACRIWLINKGYEMPRESEFHGKFLALRDDYRESAARTLVEWSVPQLAAKLLDQLEIEHDEEMIERMFEAYYRPVEKYLYACDDAVDVLRRIRERYPVLGLISNTIFPPSAHIGELRRYGLDGFFDFKIFSSEFGLRKPHPDIFFEAVNRAGWAPPECVYIGDRYMEDVEGPTGIGMHAILKFHTEREYPEDMSYSVRKVTSLSELNNHFDI